MWLLWLWLGVAFADVCYDDVFLHRIDSLLPSSGPFCLARVRDTSAEPPVLNSDEIENIALSLPVQNKARLFLTQTGDVISPLVFPVALFGDLCSSYQTVEIGRNLSSECVVDASDQNLCQRSLSASVFLSPLIYIDDDGMAEIPIQPLNSTKFTAPEWINGECHNLIKQIDIKVLMNDSVVALASAQVQYSDPSQSVLQKIRIRFFETESDFEKEETEVVFSIHVIQDGKRGPFTLPSMGMCDGGRRTSISLKKSVATGCSIRVSSCEEAQQKTKELLNKVVPTHILRNATDEERFEIIQREQSQPRTSGCLLPIVVYFDIFYARVGLITSYREDAVGLSVAYQYVSVPNSGGIPISFFLRFLDVTEGSTPYFASLPYIDLRLPADAFYPFLSSSAHQMIGLCFIFVIFI